MPDVLQGIQDLVIYLGAFVVVLSVVVFVHEFGHFQVARWRGVAIDTFSIGFGKTLFGWRDKQGVQWKIGALPLGGYVKIVGMLPPGAQDLVEETTYDEDGEATTSADPTSPGSPGGPATSESGASPGGSPVAAVVEHEPLT